MRSGTPAHNLAPVSNDVVIAEHQDALHASVNGRIRLRDVRRSEASSVIRFMSLNLFNDYSEDTARGESDGFVAITETLSWNHREQQRER